MYYNYFAVFVFSCLLGSKFVMPKPGPISCKDEALAMAELGDTVSLSVVAITSIFVPIVMVRKKCHRMHYRTGCHSKERMSYNALSYRLS